MERRFKGQHHLIGQPCRDSGSGRKSRLKQQHKIFRVGAASQCVLWLLVGASSDYCR